ncbi:MAG: sulfatase-like hydrolase/transferase [Gemmataceae bacterium]|nr:sulfatase-like hydrolase/transferase [Gemmataceae bacterium]
MSLRLALLALFAVALPVSAKPNVILILADDLGAADLGCYGSTFHKTPHLDAFAKQGVKFSQGYAACPVCSPTRAALLTGKYPARLGITDWLPGRPDQPGQKLQRPPLPLQLPLEEVTLAERLKHHGYTTAHIGKWHLGGAGFEPTKQGFDINIAGDDTGTPLSYFAPFQRNAKGNIRKMPGLETAPEGEYLTDRLTIEAEKFIRANKEKPFFLYMPHYAVHTPMRAKEELIKKYENKPTFGKQSHPVYAAMLESLDDSVGRILKVLDEEKLAENTIVIFTSDNGGLATLEGMPQPPTFNGPHREGKGYLYEGGIRVPLIVRGPGAKGGRVENAVVSSQDFVPTVCELCGVPCPTTLDGVSFARALAGGGPPERDALYWHYPHYANQGSKPGGAIREGNYKLIEFYENGRKELFDVTKGEGQNLIESKPDVAARLAEKLDAWRKTVKAKMPTPNPDYVPNPQAANGTIALPARTAEVHGVMLRFEPLPHKNTLGYWVNEKDWASWEFTVTKPGTFDVEVLQGCGTGQGGSSVDVIVGGRKVNFTVEDTGGFQAFKPRVIGQVTVDKAGRHTLEIRPVKKAKAAVMDVRQVTLKPAK